LPNATDIFVIGGGPAGLAAAIAARQRGLRVTVADGAEPPIDKCCGEGLLPDGVAALENLGVSLPWADGRVFRGIRFLIPDVSAETPFPKNGRGLAIRRTSLHRVLLEHAQQLGAEFLWRTAVTGISSQGVHLSDRVMPARWIVGADGLNSRVRRWAGLDHGSRLRTRYAFRRHYKVVPWTDRMEMHWGRRCQGYALPIGHDRICIALVSHDPGLRIEEGLQDLPELSDRLHGAETLSTERGALTGNRTFRRVGRKNVALIGDASGTVDAITGQGLGLAFSQAVALAKSLQSGDLRKYQREHRRITMRPRMMARFMLTLDGRPWLQRRALRAFRERPEIFSRLLELHVGGHSPLDLALDGITLGWGLLTA
jgi:menaquinone-9 beta-reductase